MRVLGRRVQGRARPVSFFFGVNKFLPNPYNFGWPRSKAAEGVGYLRGWSRWGVLGKERPAAKGKKDLNEPVLPPFRGLAPGDPGTAVFIRGAAFILIPILIGVSSFGLIASVFFRTLDYFRTHFLFSFNIFKLILILNIRSYVFKMTTTLRISN